MNSDILLISGALISANRVGEIANNTVAPAILTIIGIITETEIMITVFGMAGDVPLEYHSKYMRAVLRYPRTKPTVIIKLKIKMPMAAPVNQM